MPSLIEDISEDDVNDIQINDDLVERIKTENIEDIGNDKIEGFSYYSSHQSHFKIKRKTEDWYYCLDCFR